LSEYINDFLYTTKLLKVKIDSLGNDRYNISLPEIDYKLPMDINTIDKKQRKILSKNPTLIISQEKPIVDKIGWYLKEKLKKQKK
ncbi:MAG: hypothetical protein GY936_03250, partial [Ignavibacteriae bacterium]|nr:hypothetical protein [Ignavibacteriota bacterium]